MNITNDEEAWLLIEKWLMMIDDHLPIWKRLGTTNRMEMPEIFLKLDECVQRLVNAINVELRPVHHCVQETALDWVPQACYINQNSVFCKIAKTKFAVRIYFTLPAAQDPNKNNDETVPNTFFLS